MPEARRVTAEGLRILKFIRDFTRDRKYPPSLAEIGKHIDVPSTSSVALRLHRLVDAGLVTRAGRTPRSVVVLADADDVQRMISDGSLVVIDHTNP